MTVPCVIGVFPRERRIKQKVLLDLTFPCDNRRAARTDRLSDARDYTRVAKAAFAFVSRSRYRLVETLAERLAAHLLDRERLKEVTVRVSKPGAIRHALDVGVEITRRRENETAHFSLGSDLEPRRHLTRALTAFREKFGDPRVSSIYKTSPVGSGRRAVFWNLVVEIETALSPAALRDWAHSLEKREGRKKGADKNAPRALDVDLVDWRGKAIASRRHPLPHPDVRDKAHTLFPFLEIAPGWTDPVTGLTLVELAARFKDKSQTLRRLSAKKQVKTR